MKTFRKALLAVAALALTAGAVQATPVNYTFSGVIEDGGLTGQTFSGMFSFDDTGLDASTGSLALTSLNFSFFGHSYTLAEADAPAGDPKGYANFSNGQAVSFDAVFVGSQALTFTDGFGSPYLAYSSGNDFGTGSFTVAAAVSAVPEPSMLALSLAGLGLVGFATSSRRRTKSATAAA